MVHVQPNQGGGDLFATKFQEYVEIVDVMQDPNPFGLLDPLGDLVKEHPSYPLLGYVAGLQAVLSGSGWLTLTTTSSIENEALTSFARIDNLRSLASLADADLSRYLSSPLLDIGSEAYKAAPWRDRKAFLLSALPFLRFRVAAFYTQRLETALVATAAHLPLIERANGELTKALPQLARLTAAQAHHLIDQAATTLRATNDEPPDSLEALAVAVVGAQEAISDVLRSSLEAQALRCKALQRGQDALDPRLRMVIPPDVVTLCSLY